MSARLFFELAAAFVCGLATFEANMAVPYIKEFSSLRLPKHRSVFNAFTHLTAALVAYQINPLPPKPIGAFIP